MTDYVVSTSYQMQDQVSAGAKAAAAALNSMADAADTADTKVTKVGKSASTLVNQLDPVSRAAQAVASAVKAANDAQTKLSAALDLGQVSADAYQRAMQTANDKVDQARAKLAATQAVTQQLGETQAVGAAQTATATNALTQHASASSAASQQLRNLAIQSTQFFSSVATGEPILEAFIQQGHQIVDSTLATGGGISALGGAFKSLVGFVASPLGALAAAGAALLYLGTSAETAQENLINLQNRLQATRADYMDLAAQAKSVGGSINLPGVSSTDAQGAASILEAAKNYNATDAQLRVLLTDSNALSKVMGTDLATAAHTLASALDDPAAAAQKAEQDGLVGFNAALVNSITLQAQAGDKAGAFQRYLDALNPSIAGVSTKATALQTALQKLTNEFTGTSGAGQSFGQVIGTFADDQLTKFIGDMTDLIDSMKQVYDLGQKAANAASNFAATGGAAIPSVAAANSAAFNAEPADLQAAITAASNTTGVPAALLAAVQQIENAARNPDGTWPVSAAGAQGPFQFLPSTFAQIASQNGISGGITDPTASATAAGFYLTDLVKQFGSLDLAIQAFNAGPGRVQSAQQTGDALPVETQAYLQQFKSLYSGPFVSNAPAGVAFGGGSPSPNDVGARVNDNLSGAANNTQQSQAYQAYLSSGVLSVQQAQNSAQQQLLETGISQAQAAGDTDTYNKLTEALQKTKGAAADMITSQQTLARSATDSVAPLQAQDGATRDLAQIQVQFATAARTAGTAIDQTALYQAQTAELAKLTAQHNDAIAVLNQEATAQQQVNSAYGQGAASVQQAQNYTKAFTDTLKTALPGTSEFTAQVNEETAALNKLSALKADQGTLAEGFATANQIQQVQLETHMIGQNSDAIQTQIDLLKQRQDIISRGGDPTDATSLAQLNNVAALDAATQSLRTQQDAISELASFGENAFNSIGDSITQAFAQGTTAGLSFKSIMDSVLSEITQEFLKLAVLDPILNELFGTNKTTLGSVVGILGSVGSGSSGGGLLSILGLGGAASSVGGFLGIGGSSAGTAGWDNNVQGTTGGSASGLLSSGAGLLGLLGAAGLVASISSGKGISAGQALGVLPYAYKAAEYIAPQTTAAVSAPVISFAHTAVDGVADALGFSSGTSAAAAAATGTAASAAGVSDGGVAAAASAATDAASQVAAALPYIGAAIGVISDLAQGNYRGAGLVAGGAVVGGAIGSVVPVVGTAVGAAVGAAIGGLVDTIFPQHPKNPYENIQETVNNGQLGTANPVSQIDDTTPLATEANDWNANFNAFMQHLNLTIENANGVVANIGAGVTGLGQFASPDQTLQNLSIGSTDLTTNFGIATQGVLPSQRFSNTDDLVTALQGIAQFADRMTAMGIQLSSVGPGFSNIGVSSVAETDQLHTALEHDLPGQTFSDETALDAEIQKVDDFVNGTIPGLMQGIIQPMSDFQQSVAAVETQYEAAIQQAQAYGLSIQTITGLQQEAASVMNQEIVTEQDKSGGVTDTINGLWATIAGNSGNQEQADLINFDVQAKDQTQSFQQLLTDTYGNSFTSTQQYAEDMAILEQSLASQRLQVIDKYTDAAKQSVTSILQSIDQYATGLQTSDLSPLSPQDQYALASQQFNADAAAAAGGDITSASNLTGDASTFLQTSQAVNGSGAQYAADFQTVLSALANVSTNTDALTNSAMIQATQTQTDALTTAIGAVQSEIAALRAEVAQQALRPARAS